VYNVVVKKVHVRYQLAHLLMSFLSAVTVSLNLDFLKFFFFKKTKNTSNLDF